MMVLDVDSACVCRGGERESVREGAIEVTSGLGWWV